MRKTLVRASLLIALTGSAFPQVGIRRDEFSKLNFAATQHEIISILFKEEKYSEVLPEYRKILSLGLKGENETRVVQEAYWIVEQLRQAKKHSVAHQIVEETLARTSARENKFTLMMIKGKILKDEGRLDEAIELYRKAQEFQD